MININWYIFGALLLTVGMFVITSAAGWAWAGIGVAFLFGMGTSGVIGASTIVSREEVKER